MHELYNLQESMLADEGSKEASLLSTPSAVEALKEAVVDAKSVSSTAGAQQRNVSEAAPPPLDTSSAAPTKKDAKAFFSSLLTKKK